MEDETIKPPTAAELNATDRWLNARRAWKKMRDKNSEGPFLPSIELLDRYFHYPLDGEQPKEVE